VDDCIYNYIIKNSFRDLKILKKLRDETKKLPFGSMQISPDQGQLISLLIKLTSTKKILEVGTFTGYSSLVMALSLPDDGKIFCCDISKKYTSIARRYWKEAGVSNKIHLLLGPAEKSLAALLKKGENANFDMAFIDADKRNYKKYYENCLSLMRPGGLILIDNVLWSGKVVDPKIGDKDTVSIRKLNSSVYKDNRVDLSMIPVGDGLTLVRKK